MFLRIVRRIYPDRLSSKMLWLTMLMVCISTVLIAYLVEKQGRDLLLQEKEQKLLTITHVLDVELGNAFSEIPVGLTREQEVKYLHLKLSSRIESLLENTPKIGAGYYNKKLDAIVVYAPESIHQSKVGLPLPVDHPGRNVMITKQPQVVFGKQVRGNIMNAMLPIIRNGELQGYIWANELVDDIEAQTMALDKDIILVCLSGLMLTILLTSFLSAHLNKDIETIKEGLLSLPFNTNLKLPQMEGEMDDIAKGVNRLSSALNEAKNLNALILDSAADGVIAVDVNGIVTIFNPAAQRIMGYALEEVVGKPYESIMVSKDITSPLLDSLQNGVDHISEELDFPVKGKVMRLNVSSSHLKDAHGKVIGAVVIFKDMTEKREIQRVMQQTERLVSIGQLMAGVAHEIRNPLACVRGFVQYLQKDINQTEKNEYISIILKEVDSINHVIQQLLDLSKPPQKNFSAESVNQLIEETLILLQSSQKFSHIQFDLNLDNNLKQIYLDKNMIKQVLLNLLINANESMAEEGKIYISTRDSLNGHMQYIEIKDTGTGIDEEIKQKIFSPFFTTKDTGTGLGLAIVQKIIIAHQGTIDIFNHKEGGTVVVLGLPVL